MIDFFRSLFRPAPPSGATAKERLRLVLLSDHLSLAPDVVEALKRDLLAVISRYVEIDSDHADVSFEHREREVAMLASIPIKGVRERQSARAPELPSPPPASPGPGLAVQPAAPLPPVAPARAPVPDAPPRAAAPSAVVPASGASTSTPAEREPAEAPAVPEPGANLAVATEPSKVAATSANAARPRRRRRKKAGANAAATARRAVAQSAVGKPAAQA
jgi:cell division topological specificity factor